MLSTRVMNNKYFMLQFLPRLENKSDKNNSRPTARFTRNFQNVRLQSCKVAKLVARLQSCFQGCKVGCKVAKLVARLQSCEVARLLTGKVPRLSSCEVAKVRGCKVANTMQRILEILKYQHLGLFLLKKKDKFRQLDSSSQTASAQFVVVNVKAGFLLQI